MGCCSSSVDTNFKAFKSLIRPLDVIAFRGNDPVSDTIIGVEKYIQYAKKLYSHVGIVVNTDIMDIKNGIKGELYILESTFALDVVDVESKKPRLGVQIRPLEAVVNSYLKPSDTKVAYCKLLTNGADSTRGQINTPYATNTKSSMSEIREKLVSFKKHIEGASYNFNLIPAIVTCCASEKDDTGRFYCSQLVAELYKHIGVFPDTVKCNTISPVELLGVAPTNDCPSVLAEPIEIQRI